MDKTFLDELVEYPVKALHKIGTDSMIIQLLTDNPNISEDDEEADAVFDKHLFDYLYVDGTTTEATAYICVEAEASRASTKTMQNLKLYVTVICHKQFMKLDTGKFKGLIGNRRDNLVRFVDDLLNGSNIFGLGALTLDSVRTAPSPVGFTARELVYSVPEFSGKA